MERLQVELHSVLSRLRRLIRLYVWVEGLAATVAVAGTLFWLGLAVDWLMEPSPPVRIVLVVAAMATIFAVSYRWLFSRAVRPLGDSNLALLLERRYPQLNDSLLTSLRLQNIQANGDIEYALLEHSARTALKRLGGTRMRNVLNFTPAFRTVAMAAAMLVTIGMFGYFARDTFGFWIQRLMLSEKPWPRQTRLFVEGFRPGPHGRRSEKIGRGADFKLVVRADAGLAEPPPDIVEMRYRKPNGIRGRVSLTRIGRAVPGRDAYQRYEYTLKHVTQPLTIQIVGGDARIDDLYLEVVEVPQIVEMMLRCRYPSYLGRKDRTLVVSGTMQVPSGTDMTIAARANKHLTQVRVIEVPPSGDPEIVHPDVSDPHRFRHTLGRVEGDRRLLFELTDIDGVHTQTPYRLALEAMRDAPPQVRIRVAGVGQSVTPNARIRLSGQVQDDYAVHRVWMESRVDEQSPVSTSLVTDNKPMAELDIAHVLDASKLPEDERWEPDQKVNLAVKASDAYDLAGGPNVGTSQLFVFDVVTSDELRSILQRRELLLRRRFETIRAEMMDTRDLMTRIPAATQLDPEPPEILANEPEPADQQSEKRKDFTADPKTRLRLARTIQNIERAAHESGEVADAFEVIRDELVNNRIDSVEHRTRLEQGIVQPLRGLSTGRLPALEDELRAIQAKAADQPAQNEDIRNVLRIADEILVEMQKILDAMLELESYNEVIEMLRDIIDEQQSIQQRTKQQRQDKLRQLLGD